MVKEAIAQVSDGQIGAGAAEIYETFFVPALFEEWAPRIAAAAALAPGWRVLDVACGTGVLAREAERRVRPGGAVIGLDRNPGMLAVARRRAAGIAWQEGLAEALPFADATFDAVASQFGLMFFDDRAKALGEMWRVLKSGGRMAVAVWCPVETSPGYAAMLALLQRLFGQSVADELRAPFVLGDAARLAALFAAAGVAGATVAAHPGRARFPSIEAWVHTEIKGWTLADRLDEAQYRRLLGAAEQELAAFRQPDGTVAFDNPALIATARRN